ncbi:hypothetical protein FACS1894172_16230 [Spirochaetia bacterium]|nr:hypothetical protein FACS1894172_16230 [Spirochaetia bacterium]
MVLFCAFLAEGSGFAQTANHQKIIPIDSDIYEAIKILHISQGIALPSTAGPWSEDELLLMLNRIDPARLRPEELNAYHFAERELTRPEKAFQFFGTINAEAYTHANPEKFTRTDDYIRPMNLTQPFLALNVAFRLTPYAYGMSEFSLGNEKYNTILDKNGKKSVASSFFGSQVVSSNIPMIPPGTMNDLNFNFPTRAFVSLGAAGWNVEIGRERLSWGPGESGNFMIGSQVDYHNNVRATFYSKQFKYIFNVSGFPSPDEYYAPDSTGAVQWLKDTGWEHQGLNLFIAHRLEWRMLKDKLNMALNESIMYQPENGVDMQYFMPTIILHNLYRAYEANSLLTLEADYALMPALNIYGQIAIDDFHLPGEPAPGTEDDSNPDAFGFMLGAKTALPVAGGILTGSFEAAYTQPYLYLRSQSLTANKGKRELNYVVANRYESMNHGSIDPLFVEEFLGYRWGGDAIVLNAKTHYHTFGKWQAGANLLFMIHGTFDKWTKWTAVDMEDAGGGWEAGIDVDGSYTNRPGYQDTPTSSHYQGNYTDANVQNRNAPYILTALSLFGSYQILPSLKAYGQADVVLIANKGNIKGNFAADFQFSAGISWTF